MKLVEILAREWKVWQGMDSVQQTYFGEVFCSNRGRDFVFGQYEIAEDQDIAVVSCEQWGAERDRIAAEEFLACHIAKDAESWRAECEKQYEQELWDKVASKAYIGVIFGEKDHYLGDNEDYLAKSDKELAQAACEYADAFMAERAKRLKEQA